MKDATHVLKLHTWSWLLSRYPLHQHGNLKIIKTPITWTNHLDALLPTDRLVRARQICSDTWKIDTSEGSVHLSDVMIEHKTILAPARKNRIQSSQNNYSSKTLIKGS